MYVIKRNGKQTVRNAFACYDDARNHVRRLIRKQRHKYFPSMLFDWNDAKWRTPEMGRYGYSIHKV